jgi:hypothetical protein
MKDWMWFIVGGVLILGVGFILGATVHPGFKPGGTIITNTVYGNYPVYYPIINATNEDEIFNDYKKYKTSAFIFIQQNNTMTATLYDRHGTVELKDWNNYNGLMLGGGYDVLKNAPAIIGGYHWTNIALLGTVTISTNFGIGIYALWMF